MLNTTIIKTKQEESLKLSTQVENYLLKGGKITVLDNIESNFRRLKPCYVNANAAKRQGLFYLGDEAN